MRRHLYIAAWIVLTVQVSGLALGTVQVCRAPRHTHGGVETSDCAMHHQMTPAPATSDPHAHHAGMSHAVVEPRTETRMSCRCETDVTPMSLGQAAILQPSVVAYAPLAATVIVNVGNDVAADRWSPPPSPPPR